VELVHRSVAGIATGVILGGPPAAVVVVVTEVVALLDEAGVELGQTGGLEGLAINLSGEP
jgi:hypothetical protein